MNLQDELYSLLSEAPLTSVQLREQLCKGECPALLAELQRRSGVSDRVPSTQQIGNSMRALATETGLVCGAKGGHHWTVRWSVAQTPKDPTPNAPEGNVGAGEGIQERSTDHLPAGWEKDPKRNPALHVVAAPTGYHQRGVSTLRDGAGNIVQQWSKTARDRDAENLEYLFEAIKSLPESFRNAHVPIKPPAYTTDDMLVLYPILDVHLGMLSWCKETGNSYDTDIAERLHLQAIEQLVSGAPSAKHAVVASLGDFYHFNDNDARTERSGNPLDTDSRFARVLKVGMGIQRAMIDAALRKHEHVWLYVCVGNHDAQASLMLALGMELFYAKDPRVTVCTSPAKFLYHRFGKCLFGFTHGDGVKSENLPGVMACDRAKDWGETTTRKFLVGHIHKERVLDMNGCKVEHYRTLAGLEAYAYNSGYRTDRGMSAEYYHREHGFMGNAYVPLSLLEMSQPDAA